METIEAIKIFGFDPNSIGLRSRGWSVVEGPDGNLVVCARDGGDNDIDEEACKKPNFVDTYEDDFDCTYRYYVYSRLINTQEVVA